MPEGAYEKWQFPNAYVAIDGKQISLFHPHSGASEYYKGFYSLLFMAIVTYDYLLWCWLQRWSEESIFCYKSFCRTLENAQLNLPDPAPLQRHKIGTWSKTTRQSPSYL